ncbi:10027_t:CDS:10 [Scutellospora calospora]|uniref:10027_t:CDS:1 n=1 Tax=Scutellospora calospora TaxID=85575 RepID=A0ACA9JZA2_9GLOM|nr:10027_t:CDS:10 [Scutellospora calospora]
MEAIQRQDDSSLNDENNNLETSFSQKLAPINEGDEIDNENFSGKHSDLPDNGVFNETEESDKFGLNNALTFNQQNSDENKIDFAGVFDINGKDEDNNDLNDIGKGKNTEFNVDESTNSNTDESKLTQNNLIQGSERSNNAAEGSNQTQTKKFFKKASVLKQFLPSSWRDNESSDTVKVVFHAHFPPNIESKGNPVVIGNIIELGKWKEPIIQLQQPYRRQYLHQYTTYWISEPVSIPIAAYEEGIRYRYAIYVPRKTDKKNKEDTGDLYPEVGIKNDFRFLELKGGNQFDIVDEIVIGGNRASIKEIRDFTFVEVICESLTSDNIKEKITEYQDILNKFQILTRESTDLRYIVDCLQEIKSKEKRLFLCVLLGHYVQNRRAYSFANYYSLPKNFPSLPFIECLEKYQPDNIPEDAHEALLAAISALVRHNAFQGAFDWLKVFVVAHMVDPNYSFIEDLTDMKYNEELMQKFIKHYLPRQVVPYITNIENDKTYARIASWLIHMCCNFDPLLNIWADIIEHTPERDELLRKPFLNRVQIIISTGDAIDLTKHFEKVPVDLRNEVAEAFRRRAIQLLGHTHHEWNKQNANSIQNILLDSQLNWHKEDFLEALRQISLTSKVNLLAIFPKLLQFWFKFNDVKDEISETVLEICSQWYQQLLDHSNDNTSKTSFDDRNFTYSVFDNLSHIYPIIKNHQNIFVQLIGIAIDRVKQCSEDQILRATSLVIKLEPKIYMRFGEMVKGILKISVRRADDNLLTKLQYICGCNSKVFNIPHELCEEIICYTMERLQLNYPILDDKIASTAISLLDSSKFWIFLLHATGHTEQLNKHPYIIQVKSIIFKFSEIIKNETISIRSLQELLQYDNETLYQFFDSAIIKRDSNSVILSKDSISKLRKQCEMHELILDQLRTFYTQFCSHGKVKDVQQYLDDINTRTKRLRNITLNESQTFNHWEYHKKTRSAAERVYKTSKSQTFRNIFEIIIQEDKEDLTVETVAQTLIPKVFKEYEKLCREYGGWEKLKCSEGSILWKNVSNINNELDIMDNYVKMERNQRLLNTLTHLSKVPIQIERLQQLTAVVIIFRVTHTKNDWLEKLLLALKGDYLWLGKLNNYFEIYNKYLSSIDENCWELIKELSNASDFIIFLRSVAEHDIKNLINGVDDHSDERLIQEDTVSSLIQVKQFLLPLLNSAESLSLEQFLQDLRGITDTNPSLGSKIALCNSSNMALQNMYNNISNRGEVTKEKIRNAVKKGTYTFKRVSKDDRCSVMLTYPSSTESKPYSLNDLHDLRGRALLISKPGAAVDLAAIHGDGDLAKNVMDEFVVQVDLANEIINIASKLIQMGHFGYREFSRYAKGTETLQNLEQELKKDLKQWDDMVNKAQEEHYYLTFFPARHILAFYDYFTSKDDPDNVEQILNNEECSTLIRFVNSEATLPSHSAEFIISSDEQDYYQILCQIGTKLQNIFTSVPRKKRRVKDKGGRVMSDVVYRGKLFVAACSDKNLVPNIIMSLYVNHGTYPQPWQLLICTSSTTMEELTIFIKRCFFAASNGYNGYLFCMANLELLDFELQYNLVNNIRSMRKKQTNYHLALICCRETGMHHHILDQFSQDVYATNGLGTEAMKVIYNELHPNNVKCLSSDLSGQGKSEYIRQESFANGKVPRSFLISDGVDFGTLVHKFKEFKIRRVESLHINIVSADHPVDVNMFLFELLTLGVVSNNMDIAYLPDTFIFIEIASTVNQYLLKSLPITGCLRSEHLTWNIEKLMVSQEINSPIQVVCRYLLAHSTSKVDDKDIVFRSTNDEPIVLLKPEECQSLIEKYLFKNKKNADDISSFRFVEIFVNVLADQLVRLSSSSFFECENLKLMIKDANIRTTLLYTLIDVSKDFATRSINTKAAQLESTSTDEDARLGTIVQWDDSNHLLVFFLSQTPDSICALYRDKAKVPQNVRTLLKSQYIGDKSWELEDYHEMSTNELLEKLECLARKTMHKIEYPQYALSADNLVKMALILLRSRANIPVVICGEAGCGKTSLIGFLAKVVEVEFQPLNLHAGVTENAILKFMSDAQAKAENGEIWLFFDEINTCNHIGLLADLIAHRTLLGKQIHSNMRIFAACNPYRIRTKSQSVVGLKTKKRYDEQSNLVYQVKPLPDQILDYVWDYGVLHPEEERRYIQIMVSNSLENFDTKCFIFAKLLFRSQAFIREVEEPYSVSLRDVKRAITLVNFFAESLQNRPPVRKNAPKYPPIGDNISIPTRCYILALGLCYQSRLYDQSLRKKYRIAMENIFRLDNLKVDEKTFNKVIRQEQNDYINRMTCPPNTAKNEALLENVLVMIVCILTRIPVFIIGAPGQNLRGSDSNDEYFRKLPQVYLIPHQGSSSSTSDGILKVFQKAQNYQETSSKEFPVISVVLLDEVGLAETSPFNPLKVLHSLLEPSYPSEGSTVSVVGISNWRLDNSKSSRALPKFDLDDLVDTAVRLLYSKTTGQITKASLQPLADAYSNYEQNGQSIPNFHGLRDYYALVKSLSLGDMTPENIQMALVRNFGGTDQNATLCEKYFGEVLKAFNNSRNWIYNPIPVEKLINANLDDEGARHLMVIGKSDSIVNLLTYQLRKRNLDPVVILGSQFPDDQDDYSYSVLSRIMMCVEAGRPLILTDLEIIYGSLYDLWNQNYIVVGSAEDPKYYTRVALGAYANPMLYVAKTFRCILVLDEKKLKHADPPLLNRFEKQKMTINDTLTKHETELVQQLSNWAKQMVTVFGKSTFDPNGKFSQKDLFIGFDPDETLQSLVIDVKKSNPHSNDDDILEKCKENLIAIASSDGIIRTEKSILDPEEIAHWKNVYFKEQHHDHLADHIQALLDDLNEFQIIVNTFSNINTDVKACLNDIIDCQVDKLSTFKTESQLQNRVKHFWLESTDQLLVLQCDVTTVNAGCIKLAKFIIEQFRNEFLTKRKQKPDIKILKKHACIILHIHREQETSFTSFNFMCGWNQVTIETLLPQERPLSILLNGSLCDIINTTYPFEDILEQELLWCLLCMKYPSNTRSVEHIKWLNSEIYKHPNLLDCLKTQAQEWLQNHSPTNWQYIVASNKKLLYPYASFSIALQAHIRGFVRKPIARILCTLERLSVTRTFFFIDKLVQPGDVNRLLEFWMKMFNDKKIINIEELPEPSPDSYIMPPGVYDLQFPFSYYFMKQIDGFKALYLEEIALLHEDPINIDSRTGELVKSVAEEHMKEFTNKILNMVPLLKTSPIDWASMLYFKDFVTVIAYNEPGDKDPALLELIFEQRLGKEKILNIILLHTCWWKHGNSIISELRLAQMCPTIVKQILNKPPLIFEQFLVEGASKMMLQKICEGTYGETIHPSEIIHWQHDVTQILSLSKKISGSSTSKSFQLLQISNDLLSTRSITRSSITQIINLGQNNSFEEFLSWKFVNSVLNILNKLDKSEKILNSRRAFILRCLNIIPSESSVRLNLYHELFSQLPFPLMGAIISKIFKAEEEENNNVFFRLIQEPAEILKISQKLEVINSSLKTTDLNSGIAALCCDIIQLEFFWECKLNQLAPYFRQAAGALYSPGVQPLQRIVSIAFLKEFVQKFWDSMISKDVDKPIKLPDMEFNPFSGPALLEDINSSMSLTHPLIHSLKIYFLRDLRQRGYAIDDVKKLGESHKEILPWFNSFSWNNDDESRLPFNPYWSVPDYAEAEKAFSNLLNFKNKAPLNQFLDRIRLNDSIDAQIAIIGIIVSKLYAFRASRKLVDIEKQAADYINYEITGIGNLPAIYKQIIARILSNKTLLFQLSPQMSSTELIMKSVIIHIIGAHASLSEDSSPLTAYLHKLQECQDQYILACPSDIESVVFNAIAVGGVSRYACKCGFKYVIANCGGAVIESKCPECKSAIGGKGYNIAAGNRRLDAAPISSVVSSDQAGYIAESTNNSLSYCVRSMIPASYRILHLFVHVIIAASAPSTIATAFVKKNNNNVNDIEKYCMEHIQNDWNVLKQLLDVSDENLALLIHLILTEMVNNPPTKHNKVLSSSFSRDGWEIMFSQTYIIPKIQSVTEATTNFRAQLDQAIRNAQVTSNILEGEINQTLPMDEGYCQEYLPRLFRTIVKTSFDSLRAYYNRDIKYNSQVFPFLNIYFKHFEKLPHIKNLYPIVKFVQILASRLGYRLTRKEANQITFKDFIEDQSINGQLQETYESLSLAFNDFANAWNETIGHVTRYQCHQLPDEKPHININSTIVFGLMEGRDTGIYLCAILEYLITLQNNFLQEVMAIPGGSCHSLNFLRELSWVTYENVSSSSTNPIPNLAIETPNPYFIQSKKLDTLQEANFINYSWDKDILQYSQHNLGIGRGQDIIYDLQKIETELAYKIVAEKVHIAGGAEQQLYLEPFPYHMELFQGSMRILGEIKVLIPQEPIPSDKLTLITGKSNNPFISYMHQQPLLSSYSIDNASELFSFLEILICFVKRTSVGDGNLSIKEFVNQWMKLSTLAEIKLEPSMENEIIDAIDFDQKSTQQQKLPAEAFTIALKRFMQRFLSAENNNSKHSLNTYLTDMTLSLWPSDIDEELVDEMFPNSLLVEHVYEAYKVAISRIEVSMKKQPSSTLGRSNTTNAGSVQSSASVTANRNLGSSGTI